MLYCIGKGTRNANVENTEKNYYRAGFRYLFKDSNRRLAGDLHPIDGLCRRVRLGDASKSRLARGASGPSVLPDGRQRNGDAHLRHSDAGWFSSWHRWSGVEHSVQSKCSLQPERQRRFWQACQSWLQRRANAILQLGKGERRGPGNHRSFDRLLKRAIAVGSIAASLVAAQLAITVPAQAAASLIVRPTRIVMDEGTPVVAVTIQNAGVTDTSIQLEIMAWSQADSDDVYTNDGAVGLLACPSVFTIPAGKEQIIRIALDEVDQARDSEGTFRLFIREIPPAPVEGQTAVQVALRIGVPIFLPPERATQPAIDWAIESRGENGLWATAHNRGNVHSLVQNIRLEDGNDVVFEAATHRYILPGATMSWRLDTREPYTGKLPTTPLELKATTDQGPYQELLRVGR